MLNLKEIVALGRECTREILVLGSTNSVIVLCGGHFEWNKTEGIMIIMAGVVASVIALYSIGRVFVRMVMEKRGALKLNAEAASAYIDAQK